MEGTKPKQREVGENHPPSSNVKRVSTKYDVAQYEPFDQLKPDDQDEVTAYILHTIGIPAKYLFYRFDGFYPSIEMILRDVVAYPKKQKRASIFMAGPVGTGKTGLLASMIADLFRNYALHFCKRLKEANRQYAEMSVMIAKHHFVKQIRFIEFEKLSNLIRAELNPENFDGLDTSEEYKTAHILMIDDLFNVSDRDFDIQRFEEIINYRYNNGLTTWLTTNFSVQDRDRWTGMDRSLSRLGDRSWCRYFELKGNDRRKLNDTI